VICLALELADIRDQIDLQYPAAALSMTQYALCPTVASATLSPDFSRFTDEAVPLVNPWEMLESLLLPMVSY
jgi:hypothetical protein